MLKIGHIQPFWDDSYKQYEYTRQPIKAEEIEEWRKLGYNHDSFSGVLYGGSNPLPTWVYSIADDMGLKHPGFTFYCMSTMEVMPVHVDHFETYCKIFSVERQSVYRGLLMLETWQSGHYLEMNNRAYTNWRAGDWYLWSADTPHAAANIGPTPRWTLQITGTLE